MALINNRTLCNNPYGTPYTSLHRRRPFLLPPNPSGSLPFTSSRASTPLTITTAAKKLSPRTGRFDNKNRKSIATSKEEKEEEREAEIRGGIDGGATRAVESEVDDEEFIMPKLPGQEPDFWEGPQWDLFGFFVQYLWAFGIVFALIACGIAVATYNEGATDFKDTPVYKESIQSRELLEEPEASNSDVFESNPTEEAPALQ